MANKASTKTTAKTAKASTAPKKKPTTKTKSTRKTTVSKKTTPAKIGLVKNENFFSTKPTIQTVYWLIISAVVLVFGIWIVYLQDQIHRIYDQIDQYNTVTESLSQDEIRYLKEKQNRHHKQDKQKKTETAEEKPKQ